MSLLLGDCLELMTIIPDGSVDMVLCDLPYGTTACRWDSRIPLEPLWQEYRRIVKPKGAIALFASQPFTSLLVTSNLKWFRCEWVWHKSQGGGFLNANRQPLKRHESVLIFASGQTLYNPQKSKGKPYKTLSHAPTDTIKDKTVARWPTINDGTRYPTTVQYFANDIGLHPTQKPVALCEYLIRTYANEGETVLDNCMGSGTTGVAALNTGRRFIGIEKDPAYFEIAQTRISGLTA